MKTKFFIYKSLSIRDWIRDVDTWLCSFSSLGFHLVQTSAGSMHTAIVSKFVCIVTLQCLQGSSGFLGSFHTPLVLKMTVIPLPQGSVSSEGTNLVGTSHLDSQSLCYLVVGQYLFPSTAEGRFCDDS